VGFFCNCWTNGSGGLRSSGDGAGATDVFVVIMAVFVVILAVAAPCVRLRVYTMMVLCAEPNTTLVCSRLQQQVYTMIVLCAETNTEVAVQSDKVQANSNCPRHSA
jgi:hypothetical protein